MDPSLKESFDVNLNKIEREKKKRKTLLVLFLKR